MSSLINPLKYPLKGSALIEASAGTGKTFTLALLYVRLVLQQGGELAFKEALLPPNILVVTFTKAATKELRDRIRQRLVEVAQVLRNEQLDKTTTDPLLLELRQALINEGEAAGQTDKAKILASAAYKLEVAAQWMDESAISTIHGWCYRMLKEHAFDSGNLFQQELIESEVDLLQQAAEDYWRNFYLSLDATSLAKVLEFFSSPQVTRSKLYGLLDNLHLLASPQATPAELISKAEEEKNNTLKPLKEQWQQEFLPALEAAFYEAKKKKAYKATSLNAKHIGDILKKLVAWAANDAESTGINYASSSFQRLALLDTSIWTDETAIPWDNSGSKALAELPEQLDDLPSPFSDLLCHAAHWVAKRVEQVKKQQSLMSNQDLLTRLDQALQGERGEQLAASIRQQFPAALVDEFQDTDPVQYRIFNSIYNIKESSEENAFFMIGDPKQAIYAFRGADIYTYLAAKKATGKRHYTLDRNFRSAPTLIKAVNGLFALGAGRPQGAFLFKSAKDLTDPIPFVEVKAGKKTDLWLEVEGKRFSPMQAWLVPKGEDGKLNKETYAELISETTASQVAELLTAAQNEKAWLVEADNQGEKEQRSLLPADIAILVNKRDEADSVRTALADKGVASVYLSENNSVYQSTAAKLLIHLLEAVAEPYNDALLRKVLSLPQMGLSLFELDELNNDELVWEQQVQQFVNYHWVWQSKGSLALIHLLIKDFKLAERLLEQAGGERQISDLLHLAELLQKASAELEGEQALIRHLQEQKNSPDENSDLQQLRLESDQQLVQVVTIHKSKGLEYPLVFLPFATHCRLAKKTDLPLKTHDDQGLLQLHLNSSPEILVKAENERLAEDLRKLYVALTRASYCQWIGLGETQDYQASALGYLLGTDQDLPLTDLVTNAGLEVTKLLASDVFFQPKPSTDFKKIRAPQTGDLTNWWIASYSAIQFQSVAGQIIDEGQEASANAIMATSPDKEADTARDAQLVEEDKTENFAAKQPASQNSNQGAVTDLNVMHHFPAGAVWGTLLHTVLEWAAVQEYTPTEGKKLKGFEAVIAENIVSQQAFKRFCERRNIENFHEPLWGWLVNFVQQKWQLDVLGEDAEGKAISFSLSDLKPSQLAVELEFMLESHQVNTLALDKLVRENTLEQVSRPVAKPNYLNGLLKGFIDLVAEHGGRYYVIDWKSNRLGFSDSDYTQAAMLKQILEHRYDMQYVLYLVALHRQLKARLPHYDYDQHVGGAIYVFLRGMNAELSEGLFCDKPPKALIEKLDALLAGASQEQQGAML